MLDINVLNVAQVADPNYVKYIWWYSIIEDKFEGYDLTQVEKHADSKFTLVNNDHNTHIRGRVVLYKEEYYLLIWTVGYKGYRDSVIERVLNIVSEKFNIDYVIDECAKTLLGEQNGSN